MHRLFFFFIIFFCLNINVFAQNSKSSFHFKSIRIENGDTIVEEKNFDSDDPNFNFSDSLSGTGFSFKSRIGTSPQTNPFEDFGVDPFKGFPDFPQFENPFLNDSLMNQFFKYQLYDTSLFNYDYPYNKSQIPEIKFPPYDLETGDRDLTFADFKVAIIPETNLMNITFKLSEKEETKIELLDEDSTVIFSEKFEKEDGFYVKQLNLSSFQKGKYEVVLSQGNKKKNTSIFIDK